MRLIDADKDRLIVELTRQDWETIAGVFSMVAATHAPEWIDSTGREDTAISPEEFRRVSSELLSITRQPESRPYFVGKP
jgi:hypothetical protein